MVKNGPPKQNPNGHRLVIPAFMRVLYIMVTVPRAKINENIKEITNFVLK